MDHRRRILHASLLAQLIQRATAQILPDDGNSSNDTSLSRNFQPSLAVVIGMLVAVFSLTSIVLLLYSKFCRRLSADRPTSPRPGTVSSPPEEGVDKTVILSLPFFPFSSLRGLKHGLECSVCLSRFGEPDILRLLPGCRHGFHMDCIDRWLDSHSSCPLCRRQVRSDDIELYGASSSFRFMSNQPTTGSESETASSLPNGCLELYVERESDNRSQASSRRLDSIGRSFRKLFDRQEETLEDEEQPIQRARVIHNHHTLNHRITFHSAMTGRWSNVSSSDLVFLSSELLIDTSSRRFTSFERPKKQHTFERLVQNDDKRSMSEIVVHPRLMVELSGNGGTDSNDNNTFRAKEGNVNEERMRKVWFSIARKTARWLVNREKRPTET